MICSHCKQEYIAEPEMLKKIGLDDDECYDRKVYKGQGCVKCHHTGFKGRCGIFELLLMTKDMKSLVLQTSDANQIRERAIANGMITLRRDGVAKVLQGITTIEEVYRVTGT
jgi:general secretion pathway protein E